MKEMKVRLGKARVRAPLTMRSMMIVFRNKNTQTLCDKSPVYICTAIFNWTTNLKCYVHHQQISGNECQTKRFLEFTPFILIPKYGQSNRRPYGLLSKISMPLLLASSLRTQTCIASLYPSGEKRRPEICHLLFVSAGYLASGSYAMRKLKKESSLLGCQVDFSREFDLEVKAGKREALSPQSPSHFSHRLFALAPLENLLTDYQFVSGSWRLRKVGSKQNTITLGLWVLKVITRS